MSSGVFTPDIRETRRHVWALREEFDKAQKHNKQFTIQGESVEKAHSARGTLKKAYDRDELWGVKMQQLELKLDRTIAELEVVKDKLTSLASAFEASTSITLPQQLMKTITGAAATVHGHCRSDHEHCPNNPEELKELQEGEGHQKERLNVSSEEARAPGKQSHECPGAAQDGVMSLVEGSSWGWTGQDVLSILGRTPRRVEKGPQTDAPADSESRAATRSKEEEHAESAWARVRFDNSGDPAEPDIFELYIVHEQPRGLSQVMCVDMLRDMKGGNDGEWKLRV